MQQIDALKVAGKFFAAGALAHASGAPRAFGAHFGMKSSRDAAIALFFEGWDAAQEAAKREGAA